MDFHLTEEEKMLHTTARDFAKKELGPVASKVDEQRNLLRKTSKRWLS